MVIIRLARGGRHDRPYFSIVVADSRARRDGRFIEKIGFSNPVAPENTESVRIDLERVNHWVSNGAQLSPAVAKLLKSYQKASAKAAA